MDISEDGFKNIEVIIEFKVLEFLDIEVILMKIVLDILKF